ncbi:MAG: redox-regulated ATPase YchF [Candidatus Aenigmarchaeota archaeon]|nr:redox-regulated ATPase YchF [Candidatus Aenigmarchaeota archaeon]
MLLGICGKTNVGKTSFFSACTLVDAEISNRVFTTIKPNFGVTYVRSKCPCKERGVTCKPQNSKCVDGVRYIPVKVVDIAGLVPDAYKGRGLGNMFLTDIMTADALVHIVDISGGTDINGNPCPVGTHNPLDDIEFFRREIDYWVLGIIKKNIDHISKRMIVNKEKLSEGLYKQLSGLGVSTEHVERCIEKSGLDVNSPEEKFLEFSRTLMEDSKPVITAGNKIDIPQAEEIFNAVKDKIKDIIPCSADSELALRKAAEKGIISYMPGGGDFEIRGNATEKQLAALESIRNVLKNFGSTGVQKIIDTAVFSLLEMIVVYPVENEHKLTDKKGNVLPDAMLVKRGSTALDLAFKVHEDIGKRFISAVDARSGKSVAANHILKDGDIISIKAGR